MPGVLTADNQQLRDQIPALHGQLRAARLGNGAFADAVHDTNSQVRPLIGQTTKDKECLLQFAVLALQLADLPGWPVGTPGASPLATSALAQPLAQRLRAHPQPASYRADRRPLRVVVTGVVADQPDRLRPGVLVVPARHRAIQTATPRSRCWRCARRQAVQEPNVAGRQPTLFAGLAERRGAGTVVARVAVAAPQRDLPSVTTRGVRSITSCRSPPSPR